MTSVFDATNEFGDTALIHPALAAGIDVLGQTETVTFYPYCRTVLPLDGFVFWLRADLLTAQQLAVHGLTSPESVTVTGSLHYSSVGSQMEDETIVVRSVDFTAESPVAAFGAIAPDVMYVATWATSLGDFRFCFSRRSSYYQQAKIFHYVGDAIYPAFAAQLIDDISEFDQRRVISNSLPLWLSMMVSIPPGIWVSPPNIPFYPAYLVPDNLLPAYGVVSVPENGTRALASAPVWDNRGSGSQLCVDRATVTLYGLRNDDAWDFRDYVLQYALVTGAFGIMNIPTIRDDRRRQVEIVALAQKKYIEFEVCYTQHRARDVARQMIQQALVSFAKGS